MAAALLTSLASPPAHAAGDDDRGRRSEEVLRTLVPSPDGPGCAAAVGKRGNAARQDGRGKADQATGRPITSETVFDMASNSKQFTADATASPSTTPCTTSSTTRPAWTRKVTLGDLMRPCAPAASTKDGTEPESCSSPARARSTGATGRDSAAPSS
ncbi:serine hydrolase [Streptomyces erythrochromogenes]|uniref:serine hydrolase n=1 Tax=Streptomyces erythrochromogenes TaxID=285574 RepID=UPI003823E7BD